MYIYTKEDKFKIWYSSPEDFNEWRRKNDLKRIFTYIIHNSESFREWMDQFNLCLEDLLYIVPSRLLFYKSNNINDLQIGDKKVDPYFYWKNKFGKNKPFIINNNGQKFYDFNTNNNVIVFQKINTYSPDSTDIQSNALLFGEIPLLKIGDFRLNADFAIFNRNLDFLDLSNIQLDDRTSMYSQFNVFCSDIRNLSIKNTNIQFFNFDYCYCSNLSIEATNINFFSINNSYMYDGNYGFHIEKSKLDKFHILNTKIKNIWLFETQVRGFKYQPQNYFHKFNRTYNVRDIYENIKTLRIAFEATGNSLLTSQYYYWERNMKRKCLKIFIEDLDIIKKYGGTYFQIIKKFLKREYNFKNTIRYFRWRYEYLTDVLRNKEFYVIVHDYILSFLSWLIWGYGEKPSRVLLWSVISIFLFSLIYFNSTDSSLGGDIVKSLQYSIMTFSAFGDGGTDLFSNILKIISLIESVIGATFMGLFVTAYMIKLRN